MPLRPHRLLLSLLCALPASVPAQQGTTQALPEAPLPNGTASLAGRVVDQAGAPVEGVEVEITCADRTVDERTDADGSFHAEDLPAGSYTIHLLADGLEDTDQNGILHAAEQRQLPPVSMRPSEVRSDVTVVATPKEIAAAQVFAEEKQRVLGVIPNFYVVYAKDPAPLSPRQKFQLALRSTIDPVSFLGTGLTAGIEQASGSFRGYGQGTLGYGRRYGADFADGAISTFLGGAVLPVLLHQDPRYYYQGTGTVRSRAWHAISSVVVCRGDNGKRQFNASSVLGNFATAGISNLYYPASDRNGAGLTLANAATGTAFGAFAALMQEFVVKKLTPHLPNYGGANRK